jgi:SAM-dependent methyltransferase
MKNYPETATERFDGANLHIKYCLHFVKKFIYGDILEVGAGCGSFTKNYLNKNLKKIILTDLDIKNISDLKKRFKKEKNVKISKLPVKKINKKFDVILYFHVLEHIKNDNAELISAKSRLKKNGYLIIMVPSGKKIFGNLDKAVGHFRRYERSFFKKKLLKLKRVKLYSLDIFGYWLYFLNKIFFKKEIFPSKFKIFLWDKIFTPMTIVLDRILNYKYGKCILVIYQKN